MAVYTPVATADFIPLARSLGLELVGDLKPVAQGIENTTYFFATDDGGQHREYVLTLIEQCPPQQIRFSAGLAAHLKDRGLPVPAPLPDTSGVTIHALKGKPALVFDRVKGTHPQPVTLTHCELIGDFLARSHICGQDFALLLDNGRGLEWLARSGDQLAGHMDSSERALLASEVERYRQLASAAADLPRGAIHADLFHDNALFSGERLSGVIDFYNACTDWLLLDVAIAVNDWCSDDNGALDSRRYEALTSTYHRYRPFTRKEIQHWQDMLCLASTRFWVSRLLGRYAATAGEPQPVQKDPGEYRTKLLAYRRAAPALPFMQII